MTTYTIVPCPVCRTNDVRTLADRTRIERDLEWLWEFHLRRLKPGAPIHQLFDRTIFSLPLPLQVVQCRTCGTVFRNPHERGEDVLAVFEGEEPSDPALASLFDQQYAFFVPRVRKLNQLNGGAGNVLEVGSYVGAFLRAATDAGWNASGLDVNAHANAFAQQRGVQVVAASLEDFQPQRNYDVVALWNCFDQLPDPAAALRAAQRLLRDGGILVIRVPNGACYAQRAHARNPFTRALLAWNNLASFPYRYGFTPDSLPRMLNAHGYGVDDVVLDTLVPIAGSWTRAWARWEERILKSQLRLLKTRGRAPWFEVYARRLHS
jgi:SAM-dependent methyltransferase